MGLVLNQCRSCKANIGWIKTKAGKNMPVDPTPMTIIPALTGSMTIVTPGGDVIKGFEAFGEVLEVYEPVMGYISHFATCKYANNHRREKDGRG